MRALHAIPTSAAQEEEEEEVAGRAQRERSVIGTLSRASPRATAHVERGLAHGAAVAAPPWRLRAWSPSTHEQKERRLFEPLSSPALQNQLQVFAGPVRARWPSSLRRRGVPRHRALSRTLSTRSASVALVARAAQAHTQSKHHKEANARAAPSRLPHQRRHHTTPHTASCQACAPVAAPRPPAPPRSRR